MRYDGGFRNDAKHGTGRQENANGSVWSGEWSFGVMEGVGKTEYSNGAVYDGEFRNGKKHGKVWRLLLVDVLLFPISES